MKKAVFPVNQDGRYQIAATDAGIYLSVRAPGYGGSPVSRTAIIQELTNRKLTGFESDFISRVIREGTGIPALIVNSLLPLDGRYLITATDMGIYLSVWAPAYGGVPVSKTTIIKSLIDQKLVGFDSAFISEVIKEATGVPVLIVNSLLPIDGRYQITATDVGVFLSVWAPAYGGSPTSKTAIIQELTDRKLTGFESEFISQVIRECLGVPVLVVNPSPTLQPVQSIRVKVSLDKMEARVSITISEGAPPITIEQLLNQLKSAGVVYGIDEAVLKNLVKMGSVNNVVCARGTLSCSGDDAFLKYYIDPHSQDRPVELEDSRVDFKELNHFLCVEEGQLLVEKIPATLGISGMSVLGVPILPKPGKDRRLPVGKNTIAVDEWRLYAAINGHLHIFLEKRVNVMPLIVIDGDVDYSTGNIDFKGSVLVRGSVQTGFVVKAGGNVEVCGSVSGSMVEATNIIIRKGIQGMKRSEIRARECLVSNFIENATVFAGQDIVVSDVILNSAVYAGMRVFVEGRRGLIRGGRVVAGEVISAKIIGNPSGIVTELEVAVNRVLKDELLNIHKEIKKAEGLYEKLKLALLYMRNQGIANLSVEKKAQYNKNETEYNDLTDHIEEMRQRIGSIEKLLISHKSGRIRVSDIIYPGVKISVGPLTKSIKEELQFVSFYALDGEINYSSL